MDFRSGGTDALDVECETKRTTEKVELPLTEVGKTQSANVAA